VLTHAGADVLSRRGRLALDLARDGQLFVLGNAARHRSTPAGRSRKKR
jgi:hypothetical protein